MSYKLKSAIQMLEKEEDDVLILQEEEGRNAEKRREPPQKRRAARKRRRQTDSSSEEGSSDGNDEDIEQPSCADDDEPEIFLPTDVKLEPSDGDLSKAQLQVDPISVDVKTEPRDNELDTTNETLALEPAATKRRGRKITRKNNDSSTRRISRPTHQQMETLVDFLVQNPGIAKGLLRTATAKHETKIKWDEIAVSLNALGGVQKDGKSWAKYWAEKKFTLKRTCGQLAQSMRRTGGGVAENVPALTPIEQRLVAAIGGLQFAAGDSHVAANPIPSTSQSDVHLKFVKPTDEENLDANELESHASPAQNVETVRGITPRVQSPRRTSLSAGQRVQSRTTLDQDRDRFAEIERQRVEAETITARALSRAVEQMEGLSTAIREGSQTVANALNRIADALSQNRQ